MVKCHNLSFDFNFYEDIDKKIELDYAGYDYYWHSRIIENASGQVNVCNELVVSQINKCWCKENGNGNKLIGPCIVEGASVDTGSGDVKAGI